MTRQRLTVTQVTAFELLKSQCQSVSRNFEEANEAMRDAIERGLSGWVRVGVRFEAGHPVEVQIQEDTRRQT